MRDFASDLRLALRVFRRSPGFAAAVVLTLALGLGANATMFDAVDRVLLSPPEHVQDHEDLRFLYLTGLGPRSLNSPMAYSLPDYESIRGLPVLAAAAAYRPRRRVTMGSGVDARQAIVQDATAEFFPLLGVLPAQGRFFDAEEDRPGAAPVAVLGYGFWDREFGQDPGAIGQAVTLGSHTYEVIGVAPRGFTGANLEAVDIWVPLRMNVALLHKRRVLESRGAWWYRVLVRLEEGVTDEEAETRMTAAHAAGVTVEREAGGEHYEDSEGGVVNAGAFMTALGPNADSASTITLWLAGVSILVLLIACANVANLMLARGIDRRRERAVRLAFGVSRRRLISQALAETLVLALAGGLAAILVASWSGRALYGLLLRGIPLPDAAVSLRLVGFLGVVVLATAVVAGVLPVLQAVRTAPGDVLREFRGGSTGGGGRARAVLMLGQISLSTVLLVGAGLFVQSLQNALDVDLGFDYESLINVEFERHDGVGPLRRDALYREALRSLETMPGVERAILSGSSRPLYGWDEQRGMRASRVGAIPDVPQGGPYTYSGTEGYVETAGLRVIQGRAFEPAEYASGGPLALMVSRSFAEGVWPGLDPLRECVYLREGPVELKRPEPCRPVVGVYEDLIVRSIADEGLWSVTWPLPLQAEDLRGILVRADGDAAELVEPIRERLAALSSDIRYVHVIAMTSRVEAMRGTWRVGATLFSAFGALALIVASLGLYSMLSFAVARKSREIGIRSALGAQRRDLVGMVVRRTARLLGAGLLIGISVAVLAGRFIESALFGVPTVNPTVFGIVAVVFIAAGLLATWMPAWKATTIDPVKAMAAE
ncbi:MAG TPA: ADOP family duplicated permease [Acidobacteriota bacterium]|nr:ADOP family duplicated permease [Acidobacteriota bacterium]